MNQQEGIAGVAEIQGLYGPFSFPEKLLQQIWLRGDFDRNRVLTTDGQQVRVLNPGNWNHLGGPDFRQARLEIGGTPVVGDVEVHLREGDWTAHGHAADPAYAEVVLHVVLFPTTAHATTGVAERAIPILPLLSLLNHDLEEYAADEAIERLADHPLARVRMELLQMSALELERALLGCAAQRWRQKVHFAAIRVGRLGWEAACHHTALEIMGYRQNRAAMLAVAGAHPLSKWEGAPEDFTAKIEAQFESSWSKQGTRPANQPATRLQQYARWVATCPTWPQQLLKLSGILPSLEFEHAFQIRAVRRAHRWPEMMRQISSQVLGNSVRGTRMNTLICDGLLPLLASQPSAVALSGVWYAWPAGDIPAKYGRLLRELGVVDARTRPLSHGVVQGLIGWLLNHESANKVPDQTSAGSGA